jgi:hypothetical protein
MTRNDLSDAAEDVVRDSRILASFIKACNTRVSRAEVRPDIEVTFFTHRQYDSSTRASLDLSKKLIAPGFHARRVGDSVFLEAAGTYKGVPLAFTVIASEYEAQLLKRDLPDVADAREQESVPVSHDMLELAAQKMTEHCDDCDGTCTGYGQIPCYADRALPTGTEAAQS